VTEHHRLEHANASSIHHTTEHDHLAVLVGDVATNNDTAFQKFSEMSNIGPWLDRTDRLQWDYKFEAGYRGARSVRNGRVGGAAIRDALIAKGGHITNKHGQVVIAGYHDLGSVGGNATKDALIAKGGHITNKHGQEVIAGFHDIGSLGGAVLARKRADTVDHTHVCTSALCRRGASVLWQHGYAVYAHYCYDFERSGAAGQLPKPRKGMQHHICKKCHRSAKLCAGGDHCRVTCNTPSHKSCQHLH